MGELPPKRSGIPRTPQAAPVSDTPYDDVYVKGPGSATDGHLALFDGTTGKLVKDGGPPGPGSGDVVGPSSAVSGHFVMFDGATGKLVKDLPLALDTDGTLLANSDARVPSQKAVKTAIVSAVGGATWTRATEMDTTASLAPNASDTATTSTLGLGYRIYAIQTSRPARVRLYTSTAAQTADLSRPIGIDPAPAAGVVLDYVTTSTSMQALQPLVEGANLDGPPSVLIPMTVTNLDTATGTVAVTFIFVRTE